MGAFVLRAARPRDIALASDFRELKPAFLISAVANPRSVKCRTEATLTRTDLLPLSRVSGPVRTDRVPGRMIVLLVFCLVKRVRALLGIRSCGIRNIEGFDARRRKKSFPGITSC